MGDDGSNLILVYRTLIPKKLINMYFYYRGSDDEPVDLGVITQRSHKAVLFGGVSIHFSQQFSTFHPEMTLI